MPLPAWVAMDRSSRDVKEEGRSPAVVQVAQAPSLELEPPLANSVKPLPPLPSPAPPVLELLPKRSVEPPSLPVPMIPLPALPPVAPAPAEKYAEAYRISQQGDSPMMRTWKKLSLHTLLAAVLASAPIRAEEKSSDVPAKGSEDSKKMVDALEKIVTELKELRTDLTTGAQGTTAQLSKLNDRMLGVEQAINNLRSQMQTVKAFASPAGAGATPATNTGRVRLANRWPTDVTVILNGVSHRLAPNQVESVNAPSGSFSFEVLGIQPPATRTLNPREEYEITIR